ncbi:hypothetical protein M514_09179 [Trichuris suis]|uniref:ALMS motif domain-containing protein n=1 Tax=Trichuris suis TaxID=68888 RepID=A0A085MZS3_9BILA|nr:hypothetical protein M514_09179 [Trichuris suis]
MGSGSSRTESSIVLATMPVSNDETKLNVRIVEISRFCSSLLERSGQTVSGDESQASSGRDLDSNVCSTSEMLNSWRPFDAAREGDDASSTSDISSVKDRSLEARIRASSAREEYEQLKLLIHEQRKKYKSRVLAERAKRKAIERLFAQKNASSPSESEGATSDFTLAQSSQETDWSDQFLSDLVRKTAHRRVPARQFKNKSTQALSGYCSCSNGSYRSAASRRPQPNAASESPSAPSSSSAEEVVTNRGLWFLPLHSNAESALSLQADALRTRRPHVVRSIENRRERLRKSRSYRGMLSAKIRQQAEHVALGLISEQEARNAILSLPRPDVFLNVDLVRETRRNHRYLPEQLRKKADYRKQLELATNRILSRMVAQRERPMGFATISVFMQCILRISSTVIPFALQSGSHLWRGDLWGRYWLGEEMRSIRLSLHCIFFNEK